MVQGYTRKVKAILEANGCSFVRHGKGDHDIWISPFAPRPFPVDGTIMSRQMANAVLKQAGLKDKV